MVLLQRERTLTGTGVFVVHPAETRQTRSQVLGGDPPKGDPTGGGQPACKALQPWCVHTPL